MHGTVFTSDGKGFYNQLTGLVSIIFQVLGNWWLNYGVRMLAGNMYSVRGTGWVIGGVARTHSQGRPSARGRPSVQDSRPQGVTRVRGGDEVSQRWRWEWSLGRQCVFRTILELPSTRLKSPFVPLLFCYLEQWVRLLLREILELKIWESGQNIKRRCNCSLWEKKQQFK